MVRFGQTCVANHDRMLPFQILYIKRRRKDLKTFCMVLTLKNIFLEMNLLFSLSDCIMMSTAQGKISIFYVLHNSKSILSTKHKKWELRYCFWILLSQFFWFGNFYQRFSRMLFKRKLKLLQHFSLKEGFHLVKLFLKNQWSIQWP